MAINSMVIVLLTRAWEEGYSNRLVYLCVCLLLDMLRKYFVLHMKQYGNGKIAIL